MTSMELIVAVYDNWGIGNNGTQPVVISADRKFFQKITKETMIIAGRHTVMDFPNKAPLPNRINVVITNHDLTASGFITVHSPEEAAQLAQTVPRAIVIGGGSIYRQMLSWCNIAYVTKIHCTVPCDTYFPNLEKSENWHLEEIIQTGEENGVTYDICLYKRKGTV